MSDWEIQAPDDATMQQALDLCGLMQGDGSTPAHVRYSLNYYGRKYLQSGTKAGVHGTVANMVLQSGVYAIVRWLAPNIQLLAFPPAGVTLPVGVTVIAIPANSPIKWA